LSRAAQKQLAGCATRWLFFGCFHKPSGFFCEPFFKRGGVLDPLTLHGAVLQSPGFYNSKNGAGVPSVHFLTQANQATVIFKPGPLGSEAGQHLNRRASWTGYERGRQLRRPYYSMRSLSQTSLISQPTIINIVSTTTGAANVASIVSIFAAFRATMHENMQILGLFPNWNQATAFFSNQASEVGNRPAKKFSCEVFFCRSLFLRSLKQRADAEAARRHADREDAPD
jgi:hypothetical protein